MESRGTSSSTVWLLLGTRKPIDSQQTHLRLEKPALLHLFRSGFSLIAFSSSIYLCDCFLDISVLYSFIECGRFSSLSIAISSSSQSTMSKLSQPLKELIASAHAKPGPIPAPKQIRSVYDSIAKEAKAQNVGLPAWLTLSTATTMTMNSPDSMLELHRLVSSSGDKNQAVHNAELMREVGLKCISFNGVRTPTIPSISASSELTCIPY